MILRDCVFFQTRFTHSNTLFSATASSCPSGVFLMGRRSSSVTDASINAPIVGYFATITSARTRFIPGTWQSIARRTIRRCLWRWSADGFMRGRRSDCLPLDSQPSLLGEDSPGSCGCPFGSLLGPPTGTSVGRCVASSCGAPFGSLLGPPTGRSTGCCIASSMALALRCSPSCSQSSEPSWPCSTEAPHCGQMNIRPVRFHYST